MAGIGGVAHASNGAQATALAEVSASSDATSCGAAAPAGGEVVDPRVAQFASLLAPVGAGTIVAGATVSRVNFDDWGRGTAELTTADGASVQVDVCAKDDALAHEAVAATERYQLFLRNGADGATATEEEVAQAISTLADAIRANEAAAPVAVLTKSEYWARGC